MSADGSGQTRLTESVALRPAGPQPTTLRTGRQTVG